MNSPSFDIIRHIAALIVLFSHNFVVFGYEEPSFFHIQTLGGFAVMIFFSISGFLIAKSFVYSTSSYDYLKKRFFRLFPGLFFCAFLLSYFYCGMWGRADFISWITSFDAFKNFIFYATTARNEWLILSEYIPSLTITSNYVTEKFVYYPLLNGPLWSLLYEIVDYIILLILFSSFSNKSKASLYIVVFCFIAQFIFYFLGAPTDRVSDSKILNYLINELMYKTTLLSIVFFLASYIYFNKEKLFSYKKWLIFLSIFSMCIAIYNPKLVMFYALGVPFLILSLGFYFKDKIIAGRFDYSYGIYIYAWPIQQFFANIFKVDFILSFFLVIVFTLIFASISWHFIEKPALKFLRK